MSECKENSADRVTDPQKIVGKRADSKLYFFGYCEEK